MWEDDVRCIGINEGPSPALIPGRGLLFRLLWVHALSAREQMSLVVFASVAFFPYRFVSFRTSSA